MAEKDVSVEVPKEISRDDDGLPMLVFPHDLQYLSSALRSHGAAYIVNPPLPQPPFSTVVEKLFALPKSSKDLLRHPSSTVRGYSAQLSNGREWWDYTPESTEEDRHTPSDEKFKAETDAYFEAGMKLLTQCMDVLRDEYPDIPPEASEQGMSTIRYLRYSPHLLTPEAKDNSGGKLEQTTSGLLKHYARMLAHTDHGSLTLMAATAPAAPSGLYIYSPKGKPIAAPPMENTVVIIAGDCLAHWTVGEKRILPTPHEVVVVDPDSAGEERIGLAVFMRPAEDVQLSDGGKDGRFDYGQWSAGKGKVAGRRLWLVGRDEPSASASAAS